MKLIKSLCRSLPVFGQRKVNWPKKSKDFEMQQKKKKKEANSKQTRGLSLVLFLEWPQGVDQDKTKYSSRQGN